LVLQECQIPNYPLNSKHLKKGDRIMKYIKFLHFAVIINLALFCAVSANNNHGNSDGNGPMVEHPVSQNTPLDIQVDTNIALNEIEETNLSFMREEEKLARDVYLNLFDAWNVNTFNNIANAEQSHMDSVKVILDAYNLTDPAPVDRGFFTDSDLQELYDTLIAQGNISLIDALKVGALIEEVDINDLYKAISETENPAIIQVFTLLLNGSYHHLNAFINQLISQGVSYEAQILSSDEIDSILSGEIFNDDVVSGLSLDSNNNSMPTQSRFSHTILSGSLFLENGAELSGNEPLSLSSHFIPDVEDIGQEVDYFAIAHFQSETGENIYLTREGQEWVIWNNEFQQLGIAEQQILGDIQNFTIFQGELNNFQGVFKVYSGYILHNGKIVYSAVPLSFTVH
jgi:hypothetical protein